MQQFEKDSDALPALSEWPRSLRTSRTPRWPALYTVEQPDQFELSGVTV